MLSPQEALAQAIYDLEGPAAVRAALERGADPNAHIEEETLGSCNPLYVACDVDIEYVRILVEFGAQVNLIDSELDMTVLAYVCMDRQLDALDYLLRQGADPLMCSEDRRRTALHVAAKCSDINLVARLLPYVRGRNLDVVDALGMTPLGEAYKSHNHEGAFDLIDAGARYEGSCILVPDWAFDFFDIRNTCRHTCRLLYGIMRYRKGVYRDVCNLVTHAVWRLRRSDAWKPVTSQWPPSDSGARNAPVRVGTKQRHTCHSQ